MEISTNVCIDFFRVLFFASRTWTNIVYLNIDIHISMKHFMDNTGFEGHCLEIVKK